jgi:hypothetical protein
MRINLVRGETVAEAPFTFAAFLRKLRTETRLGQANALSDLGTVRRMTGDYPGAAQDLEQALDIYRDLRDRGQALTVL